MSADIFTKPFADAKAMVWNSNLKLINVFDSGAAQAIDYHPDMVKSLRGDLDKPVQTQPIHEAALDTDELPTVMVCAQRLRP